MKHSTFRRLMALTLTLPLTVCLCKGKGGKGKKLKIPDVPAVPAPEPVPDTAEQEPEAQATRDDERKKIQRRRGAAGTVLTSPLGDAGASSTGGPSLLGRMGQ